jgi:hypothetical protein
MSHPINIIMHSDGTYVINPPFTVIKSDRALTWILTGSGWEWLITGSVQGVMGTTDAPIPPYTPWPDGLQPTRNETTDQYEASLPANSGADRIYYKWQFNVINGTTIVSVDPDIGNDPQGGSGAGDIYP